MGFSLSVSAPPEFDLDESPGRQSPPPSGAGTGFPWRVILPLCLAIVGLTVAAAVIVERRHETIQGARSEIVLIFPGNTADDSRERLVKTQSEVLRSRAVLQPVAESNQLSSSQLQEKISIDTGLRSDVLTITASDREPATAQRLAAATAERYLELSRRLVPESDEGEALVRRQIRNVRGELARASAEERPRLDDRIARLQEWVLQLQVEALDRPRARLLTSAYVLDEPLRPQPRRAAAGGLGIGLLLAAAAALTLRRWGPRRRT